MCIAGFLLWSKTLPGPGLDQVVYTKAIDAYPFDKRVSYEIRKAIVDSIL